MKIEGLKHQQAYMKWIVSPNDIFEIYFCDSEIDIDIYIKYYWDWLVVILEAILKVCGLKIRWLPNS